MTTTTIVLGAKRGLAHPRAACVMLAPGTHRISVRMNEEEPAFSAFTYQRCGITFKTEFYAYHPMPGLPTAAVATMFGGAGYASAKEAVEGFLPKDLCIAAEWPLPVMFAIADEKDIDNHGGVTIVITSL